MNEIKKVLYSIGYVDPVTKETSGKEFLIELSQHINKLFEDYFTKTKENIILLTDAYCIYNRSRGISKLN